MSEQEKSVEPKFGVGTTISHKNYGNGKILGYANSNYEVLFSHQGYKLITFDSDAMTAIKPHGDPEMDKMKQAMKEVLEDYGFIEAKIELGHKWLGGNLVLEPGKEGVQSKKIPIEAFFKKITGVREKLRVLEQKINNHPKLVEDDKVDLQGYITRCYGSLTSFNVLFQHKESQFVGVKTSSDSAE